MQISKKANVVLDDSQSGRGTKTVLIARIGSCVSVQCEVRAFTDGQTAMQLRRDVALALCKTLDEMNYGFDLISIHHEDEDSNNCVRPGRDWGLRNALVCETDEQKIGFVIRTERLKAGHSQKSLAKLASISETHLSHIERGQVRIKQETLLKLQVALKSTMPSHAKPG